MNLFEERLVRIVFFFMERWFLLKCLFLFFISKLGLGCSICVFFLFGKKVVIRVIEYFLLAFVVLSRRFVSLNLFSRM